MSFIYDLSDTWNNAGISWNGIKLNVTDTASAVTSKLADLQIGGVSKFSVSKTGAVTATGLIESTAGGFKFPDGTIQTTRATGTGTVTSVTGAGTISGLTLTGSITTSGTLTLGGTLALTSANVTDALGFTPYNSTNPSGYITAASAATTYQPLDGDLTAIAALAGTSGIIRKTAANTYTLDTSTYLTGITSSQVTTALGYTPATAAQGAKADTAVQTISSADGSITITGTTAIDLSVAVAGSTSNVLLPVRNTTGATLTKGTAVYISGATGQLSTVSKAIASSDPTSAQTLGLVTANISNNANGNVTLIGTITNIDTSAYTDGQQLYLSPTTAGTLTATKPHAPQHLVYMAVVEHAHPSQGKLFVKVQNGYEMDELHDVSAQSPANNDGLFYSTLTDLWEKKSIATALGYTPYNATNPAGYTTNTGTVTSVNLTAGTGVSVSGGPVTSSGSITVTNTAPDQVVSITGAGTATVTGTYPNFTVTTSGGSGTVTSVAASGGTTGLTFTGSPITTSGTLTLGGTLATANGGTNLTSYTTGDLVYASATNTLSKLGIGTSGYVLTSNGSVPSWGLVNLANGVTGTLPVSKGGTGNASWTIGSLISFSGTTTASAIAPGTPNYVLTTGGTGTIPSWTQVSLTAAVTGTLPVANGGTSFASYTIGDLLVANGTTSLAKLADVATGNVLISGGVGVAPSYGKVGLTTHVSGTLPLANGGTGQTTKAAAFNALSPVTSTGDLIIGNGSNSNTRLPIGTNGYVLTSNGTTASWQAAGGGGGGVTSFDGGFTGLGPYSPTTGAVSLTGTLSANYGGTGTSTTPSNGQLLIGNGSGYSVANLTAGANVTITNSYGGITIAASGGGGGGPTINFLSVSISGYSPFQPNAPTSNYSKPLVGTGGMAPSNYGSFTFKNMSGGYNVSGGSINSIGIQDSTSAFVNYISGSDFSGYPSNLRVDDSILSCYGMQIYNAAMFTLFTDTANAMTSPNLAPFDAMSAYSSSNPDIQVSTDMGTFFKTGGGGIVVDKNMSNYVVCFGTGNPSYTSGMTVNSIQFKPGGSGAMYTTYYSVSDFYVSYSENTSMGMFQMMMTVYNPTLQTLLDNSFRA